MCWLLDVRSSYRTPEFSADCTLQAGGGAAGLDFSEAARRLRHGAVWLLRREWDGINMENRHQDQNIESRAIDKK